MMLDLVQRVVARFAARAFDFKPMPMESCKHCGGDGVHADATLRIKVLCVGCLGTGTDFKSYLALREKVEGLVTTYQQKKKAFEDAKRKALGRGGRHLGMMGMELQDIAGEFRVIEPQLQEEHKRFEESLRRAKFVCATLDDRKRWKALPTGLDL